jgi:ABC-type Mn2+/Zn2+ transport system ATPase subunit
VAQALAREADVLLLDEPITGLDLLSQERILAVIEEERHDGRTVVLTTHHLDEARHCDEVVVLDGRLVAVGPPDDILVPAVLREAYGERVLGDHAHHAHAHDLVLVDDHGHGHDAR